MELKTELATANNLTWLKVLAFFLPIWIIALLSSEYPVLNDIFVYLLVAVIVSWFMMRLDGRDMKSLNALPSEKKHWKQLFWGCIVGITLLFITALITNFFTGQHWAINKNINVIGLLMIFFMNIISAFLQEFTYRGYPFQTLLNNYGQWVAQFVIILPFGIMHLHWNMGVEDMIITVLTTGMGSMLYGEAYIKTKNLSFPFALHFGWNLAQTLIPRHPSQNGNGIVQVITSLNNERNIWFLIPYFLVMVTAYLILKFKKNVS